MLELLFLLNCYFLFDYLTCIHGGDFSVDFIWSRAIGNIQTCSWPLVHGEKGSYNLSIHSVASNILIIFIPTVEFHIKDDFDVLFSPNLLQSVALDQGLDADLMSEIEEQIQPLFNEGLRQRIIALVKVGPDET